MQRERVPVMLNAVKCQLYIWNEGCAADYLGDVVRCTTGMPIIYRI